MRTLFAVVAMTAAAQAHALTGNNLNSMLSDESGRATVFAYVRGVLEAEVAFGGFLAALYKKNPPFALAYADEMPTTICPPEGFSIDQAFDLVRKELATRPERRHLPAYVLVRGALRAAWPCP